MATIIVNSCVWNRIFEFYSNVEFTYPNTWDIYDTLRQIDKINWVVLHFEIVCQWNKVSELPSWKRLNLLETWDKLCPWHFAFRISDDGKYIYIERAEHEQNISEPSKTTNPNNIAYKRLTKKPLFGYRYVMNQNKQYNLINQDGKLITQWFNDIKPQPQPYGRFQIIAHLNINGFLYALCLDGKTYNLHKTWKDVYTENYSPQSMLLMTETIINRLHRPCVIKLREQELHQIIKESVYKIQHERRRLIG